MKKLFSRSSKASNAAAAPPAAASATANGNATLTGAAVLTLPDEVLPFVVANELSETQKRGVAGLCACMLPDINDGSTQLQWSKMYLRLVIEHFLALAAPSNSNSSASDAFLPMLTVRQEDAQQGYNMADHTKILDAALYLVLLVPDDVRDAGQAVASSTTALWTTLFSSTKQTVTSMPLSSTPSTAAAGAAATDSVKVFRLGVIKKLLWFTVKATGYDARARSLFRHLTRVMEIPWREVTLEEGNIGRALFAEATGVSLDKLAPRLRLRDWKRNAAIGAAALAGGAALAFTGGLAAPAIAGSLLAFGEAGVIIGTAVGTTSGVTATSVLFGAAGAGVVGKKTDTRTRGVQEFQFDMLSAGDGLNVYICISGWLDKDDPSAMSGFSRPWGDSREYLLVFYREHSPEKVDQLDQELARYEGREDELFRSLRASYGVQSGSDDNDPLGLLHDEMSSAALAAAAAAATATGTKSAVKKIEAKLTLSNFANTEKSERLRGWRWKDRFPEGDQYCVVWEESLLRDFGEEMRSFAIAYAKEKLMSMAEDKTIALLKAGALAALLSAVALPKSILDMADMIDNVWVLVIKAADEAGKILAQTLREREHGLRPVTLIGYSMGARMILSCLKELAKTPDECCGIIENAVLLGTPVPADKGDWASARRVVSGRLINGFSENDWMLAIMYRYQGWAFNCSGIAAIEVDGVEDVDLSTTISGHFEYKDKIGVIMDMLSLDN